MTSTTATDLPRLMQCIGSRNMPQPVPDQRTPEDRDEGNAAHWLAEQIFLHGANHQWEGVQCATNGYVITASMIDYVCEYVGALDMGEIEVDTSWSGAGFEVRGRADHVVYRQPDRYDSGVATLTIDDFKYGWGLVEPVENWTLISHAIGWCIRNNTRPDRIVLRIHQPRPQHPLGTLREWSCSYEELMGYYSRIEAQLSRQDDELVTGPACGKCPSRYDCRAFDAATYNALDVVQMPFDDTLPKDVITEQFALFERAAEIIKTAKEAREELITHRIKQGEVFEGYSLERRYGNRRWKSGLTGKGLSLATGKDLVKDDIVTPAEAIRRGADEDAVNALCDKPLLAPKLKRIDADAKARAAFGEP